MFTPDQLSIQFRRRQNASKAQLNCDQAITRGRTACKNGGSVDVDPCFFKPIPFERRRPFSLSPPSLTCFRSPRFTSSYGIFYLLCRTRYATANSFRRIPTSCSRADLSTGIPRCLRHGLSPRENNNPKNWKKQVFLFSPAARNTSQSRTFPFICSFNEAGNRARRSAK